VGIWPLETAGMNPAYIPTSTISGRAPVLS
jgi:hypothetical protein